MVNCGMQDMKCTCYQFTWNNKERGEKNVLGMLDRIMVNQASCHTFHEVITPFLPEGQFDHCPIMIVDYPSITPGKRPFRYFHMLSESPKFCDLINEGWIMEVRGCPMFKTIAKLNNIKRLLKKLNDNGYSDIQAKDVNAYQTMTTC